MVNLLSDESDGVFKVIQIVDFSNHHDNIASGKPVRRRNFDRRLISIFQRNDIQSVFGTELQFLDTFSQQLVRHLDLTDFHAVVQRNVIQKTVGYQTFSQTQRHISFRIHHIGADPLQDGALLQAGRLGDYLWHLQFQYAHGGQDAHIHFFSATYHHHVAVLHSHFS